ncbi:MAG: hypothetical protein WC831_06075 [Parcubacteria group bacterium]
MTFAQDNTKKKAYYFYGDQCPHCHNVDEYFKANGIYEKYDISKLEFSNPFNTRLLLKFGDAYNDSNKGAVPAVAFGDKFIVGDQPIIDNFTREIDAAENANELPDPDNKVSNSSTEPDAETQPAEGNKKSYFPVIIVALVLVGGGALVFVNRKKNKE